MALVDPDGYVKIWRCVREFFDSIRGPYDKRSAWIDLIMLASWQGGKIVVGLTTITLKRGEFIASHRFLAKRWRWSKNKVENFMNFLLKMNDPKMRTVRKTPSGTIWAIANYDKYQGDGKDQGTGESSKKGHQKDQERDRRGTGEGQSKEGKEGKEEIQKMASAILKEIPRDLKPNQIENFQAKDIVGAFNKKFKVLLNYGLVKNCLRQVNLLFPEKNEEDILLKFIREMSLDLKEPARRFIDMAQAPGKYLKDEN